MSTPVSPDLTGQVAIVTGASRGIGKGLALGLARAGASVVCAARTVKEVPGELPGTIHQTVAEIADLGGQAIAVRCDIGIPQDVEGLVAATVEHFGRLDVLVNNAMAPTRGLFDETTLDMWDESFTTNVRSLFTITKAAVPVMEKGGGGSIINISSGAAEHAASAGLPPGYAVYSVSKAAMERFSSAMANELAPKNIAMNALRPGAVKTELATRDLGEDFDWSEWKTPDSVVPGVNWLAVQRADGFTGQVVDVRTFGTDWP